MKCPVRTMINKDIIRKDLILESCGQFTHICGCYIRFSNNKIHYSKSRGSSDVIIDYDINGDMVGIEFYEGL